MKLVRTSPANRPVLRKARLLQALAGATASVGLLLASSVVAAPPKGKLTEAGWFTDFSAAEFRKLPEAQEPIDPKKLNEPLLSAAVFHETNRRRAKQGLSILAPHAKVRAAALKHAKLMAKGNYLSHGTKQDRSSTPYQRMQAEGLNPAYVAENVAYNHLLRYESGKPYYTREEDGKTVYSYKPDGKPLEPHTYVSFAEAILTQWMNSPGHRKNIVSKEPRFLGVGCALSKDGKGFDTVYGNQGFFTPLE